MAPAPSAVGVANHNGWAHMVSVALADGAPVVLDRRRVVLIDAALPSQPYHHEALELPLALAQQLVDTVRRSAADHARMALATLRAELDPGHALLSVVLRASPFGALPADVTEVLAYRPFIYAADTMLYLEVLGEAAAALNMTVVRHGKGEEFSLAALRLGIDEAEAEALVKALGPSLGPPWTAEHQRAAAAAIGALAS